MLPFALSIAGSDPSGGAGIQADLKAFHQHGVAGGAVIAALTVQNAQRCERVVAIDAALVGEQLDAVLADQRIAAAKTGALGSAANVREVAARFALAQNALVVDPVRSATHGAALLEDEGKRALLEALLPCARLVTPNASEAAWLTGHSVKTLADAERAARALLATGVGAVLIKGGHLDEGDAVDLLYEGDARHELRAPRVPGRSVHGLGCALSAAITARLALGHGLFAACEGAKRWISAALERAPEGGRRSALDAFAPAELGHGSNSSLAPK